MRHPRLSPAWLKHEKQVLRWYGFFQETVTESAMENSRYRHVYIMYFLEDGTVGINEPKVENSGMPQGNFLKRQKVQKANGTYLGPDDIHIGSEVTTCGHTFHICGCDRFTRWFFAENGVTLEEEPRTRKYNHARENNCPPSPIAGIACRLEAIALRLEAIALRLEAIALRLEAIGLRLAAIARRLEAIAISNSTEDCFVLEVLIFALKLGTPQDEEIPIDTWQTNYRIQKARDRGGLPVTKGVMDDKAG